MQTCTYKPYTHSLVFPSSPALCKSHHPACPPPRVLVRCPPIDQCPAEDTADATQRSPSSSPPAQVLFDTCTGEGGSHPQHPLLSQTSTGTPREHLCISPHQEHTAVPVSPLPGMSLPPWAPPGSPHTRQKDVSATSEPSGNTAHTGSQGEEPLSSSS